MPRPKQRTAELREQVLLAAAELLAADGVGGFTVRGVAKAARTSTPAVYELFGDRAGLLRELFFTGYRRLSDQLSTLVETADPRTDLMELTFLYRAFVRANPVFAQLMFARPFADFNPGPADLKAGAAVRSLIVGQVRRCIRAGILHGNEIDLALVLVAMVHGLATNEASGRLGADADRRWRLAVDALITGLGVTPS